jgi:hypothetical protein
VPNDDRSPKEDVAQVGTSGGPGPLNTSETTFAIVAALIMTNVLKAAWHAREAGSSNEGTSSKNPGPVDRDKRSPVRQLLAEGKGSADRSLEAPYTVPDETAHPVGGNPSANAVVGAGQRSKVGQPGDSTDPPLEAEASIRPPIRNPFP